MAQTKQSDRPQGLFGLNIDPKTFFLVFAFIIVCLGGGYIYDKPPTTVGLTTLLTLGGVATASLISAVLFAVSYSGTKWTRSQLITGAATCGLFVVSVAMSRDFYSSLIVGSFLMGALLFGFCISKTTSSEAAFAAPISVITAVATYLAGTGIYEYIAEVMNHNPLWRVFGNFTNPDFFAGFLILSIPLALGGILSSRAVRSKASYSIALIVQTACLFLTGSRLGVAALVLSIITFAVLTTITGAKFASGNKGFVIAGVVGIVLLGVVGKPLAARLFSSGAENYSAQFRLYTWNGTMKMIPAKPITGFGPGSFEAAYPKFAVVGYTQHGHGSWLQYAAEFGLPLFVLTMVGLLAVILSGIKTAKSNSANPDLRTKSIWICAGISAIVGAVFHNLFDSDLYTPSTLFLFAGVVGIVAGFGSTSTEVSPETTDGFNFKGILPYLAFPAVVAIIMGPIVAGRVIASGANSDSEYGRARLAKGESSEASQLLRSAMEGYVSASSLDKWNPEYALNIAELAAAVGNITEADAKYQLALKMSATSKAAYRYARFLSTQNRDSDALQYFLRSRDLQPNNLQTQLQLGICYSTLKRTDEAEAVYRDMEALFNSPVGKVRAMPELEDWEYGIAFANLGDILFAKNEMEKAEKYYSLAENNLSKFWDERNYLIASLRVRPAVRKQTTEALEHVYGQMELIYRNLNKADLEKATAEKHSKFKTERADYESKPHSSELAGG